MVELVKTHPNAVALIVGGAHRSGRRYADELRAFVAEHALGQNVVFTGTRDDVGDVMNCMDVVAHTSVRGEPFGRVIIEGMCVGKPVVATRAGGVPEFVHDGENGLLVAPDDSTALAVVLRRLFDDPVLRDRLSTAAVQSVRDFSVEHHVAEVTRIYDRVARRFGIAAPGVATAARTIGTRV
jgi:glycosyltransferase involved in cell wall biosynthesis